MTLPHLQGKQEVASSETDQAELGSAGDNALFWGRKTRGRNCTNRLKKYRYHNIKHLTSAGKCGKMLTFLQRRGRFLLLLFSSSFLKTEMLPRADIRGFVRSNLEISAEDGETKVSSSTL